MEFLSESSYHIVSLLISRTSLADDALTDQSFGVSFLAPSNSGLGSLMMLHALLGRTLSGRAAGTAFLRIGGYFVPPLPEGTREGLRTEAESL